MNAHKHVNFMLCLDTNKREQLYFSEETQLLFEQSYMYKAFVPVLLHLYYFSQQERGDSQYLIKPRIFRLYSA